jgi:hypothetical protein
MTPKSITFSGCPLWKPIWKGDFTSLKYETNWILQSNDKMDMQKLHICMIFGKPIIDLKLPLPI